MTEPAETRPRTPAVLYLLAAVVVGGIWWVTSGPVSRTTQLEAWQAEALSPDEIRRILAEGSGDRISHALVQLGRQSRVEPGAAALAALLDEIPRIARDGSVANRELVPPAICYLTDPRADAVLVQLLDDDGGRVRLNAALGLAARNNPVGAPVLAQALEATPAERREQRLELLAALRHVAGEAQRALLEEQLRLAKLDHDAEAEALCKEALEKLR